MARLWAVPDGEYHVYVQVVGQGSQTTFAGAEQVIVLSLRCHATEGPPSP